VVQNKDVLIELRSSFDKPEKMKELQMKLTSNRTLISFFILLVLIVVISMLFGVGLLIAELTSLLLRVSS
jgi:hypothetical protein